MVVVLTGEGMGKTTAALGMAVRAVGHGLKVCIIRFLMDNRLTGETEGVKWLAPLVEYHPSGREFRIPQGIPFHEPRDHAQSAVALAREKLRTNSHDLLILDKINDALKSGLVDLPQVLELLDLRAAGTHLVFTGRDAHPELCARAHTVTDMREVKHALQRGFDPQPGIDF